MGLDIYLYSAADAAASDSYWAAWHDIHGYSRNGNEVIEDPSKWDQMSEAERGAWHELWPSSNRHEVPSEKYPEHLFNRRYLRSSYNHSGFNHAVPQMLKTAGEKSYPHERGSLYWIFEPLGREWDGDEGDLTNADLPKLDEARKRALTVVEDLKASDRLRVTTVGPNIFSGPPAHMDAEALAMYRAELPLRDGGWYSKGPDLNVFGDGLTVVAAIVGKGTFGEPAVHLVYRGGDEGFDSYVQSAEIVVEFCDEAISLVARDGSARISWSG